MFENYSYSTKLKALVVLFILLAITAYKRSFSSLVDAYQENKDLKEKINKINSKTSSLDKLSKEIATLDILIGKEGLSKEIVQQGIVSFVTKKSQNVSINNLQSIHEFKDTDFRIYTNQLDLTGNFNNLSQLAYSFETNFDYSKVVSLDYFVEKKNNTSNLLHLKIIFQNYENNK
jgi:hypothetical protein